MLAGTPRLPRAGGPEPGSDGDRAPAGHPRHVLGTGRGNGKISFRLNPFSRLSSMEEWERGKQIGKYFPSREPLYLFFSFPAV